ncbi:hypothetical protein Tco_0161933 [Tanacetum coccineum]
MSKTVAQLAARGAAVGSGGLAGGVSDGTGLVLAMVVSSGVVGEGFAGVDVLSPSGSLYASVLSWGGTAEEVVGCCWGRERRGVEESGLIEAGCGVGYEFGCDELGVRMEDRGLVGMYGVIERGGTGGCESGGGRVGALGFLVRRMWTGYGEESDINPVPGMGRVVVVSIVWFWE